jgi:hypothetical protein
MIIGWLRLGLVMTTALLSSQAEAADRGTLTDVAPDIRAWFEKQTNTLGANCCALADGHRPEQVQRSPDGSYTVRIDGHWYEVPAYTVLSGENPVGASIIWFSRPRFSSPPPPDDLVIICFLPFLGT